MLVSKLLAHQLPQGLDLVSIRIKVFSCQPRLKRNLYNWPFTIQYWKPLRIAIATLRDTALPEDSLKLKPETSRRFS
jgi:hypothetical protein